MKRIVEFIIFVFIMSYLICIPSISRGGFFDEVIDQSDSFLRSGEQEAASVNDSDEVKNISDTLYIVLLIIGIVVAVVIGGVLGITFILESAEGKAKVKEALIPYVVGCIVVFGAFGIWKIVVLSLEGSSSYQVIQNQDDGVDGEDVKPRGGGSGRHR